MNYSKLFTKRSDGRYMARFRDDSGKRVCLYSRDPKALYERIEALQSERGKKWTFNDAADTWKEKHFQRVSAKTSEAYTAPLRRLKEHFGPCLIEDITAQSVQAYLADLGKQNFSRRTVQMHHDILNMIFNNAIIQNKLTVNPVAAAFIPKGLPSTKRELPSDEAIEAVKASTGPFALFALICLYTGLRRGEVLALTYEDIDRKNGLISVNKAIEYRGNNPYVKEPKTAAGNRVVPLLDPLKKVLPKKKKGLVFGNDDGTPLTKTQYRKRWTKYCESIGFELTAHQLRHGYATILYEAGVQDKDAQELLGHSSIAVTRDVYTHIRQSQKEATAKKLNQYLKKTQKRKLPRYPRPERKRESKFGC